MPLKNKVLPFIAAIPLIALAGAMCWPDGNMASRDLGCTRESSARGQEICAALADSMRWTWLGHAIVSPGWRVTWDGLREVYCKKRIAAADIPVLKDLKKYKPDFVPDWRLESGANDLIQLLENADGGGDQPENSLFNPKNRQYILKGGCAGRSAGDSPPLPAAPPACTAENAIAVVSSNASFRNFCSRPVNGASHGCSFEARPPSPLNADEKTDRALAWVVSASIIHSFDDRGQPLFMPEGAAFASVSNGCRIMKALGPGGPLLPGPAERTEPR
jgi:hypothetical protein